MMIIKTMVLWINRKFVIKILMGAAVLLMHTFIAKIKRFSHLNGHLA